MNRRGSLTVEATIAATVFICIILVLVSILKLVLIEYVVTYCAHESAKAIADSSYLVSKINTIQEEMDMNYDSTSSEREESVATYVGKKAPGIINTILSYDKSNKEAESKYKYNPQKQKEAKDKANGKFASGISKQALGIIIDIGKQIGTNAYGLIRDDVIEWKTNQKNEFVKNVIIDTIDEKGAGLNKEKLMIELVKFPETSYEYSINSLKANYIKNGLYAGRDFDKDDCVVVISYKATLNLPFINKYEFDIRKVAIEKAWQSGDDGVITEFSGDGFISQGISKLVEVVTDYTLSEPVYVVSGGVKYHSSKVCGSIGDKPSTEMREYIAKNQGYSKCSKCR